MRPVAHRAAAVALLAAALILTAHTATATATPPQWGGVTCATGNLLEPEYDYATGRPVVIGTAARCDGSNEPATFGVVFFDPGTTTAAVYTTGMRHYNPNGQPRPFGALPPRRIVETWGVCVMSSPTVRLACVELVPVSPVRFYLRSIPVDHPLVGKPVDNGVYPPPKLGPGSTPAPECGACF